MEILDTQRAKIKEMKDAKTTKPLSQILVIVDDMADRPDVMHNNVANDSGPPLWRQHLALYSKAFGRVPCGSGQFSGNVSLASSEL